MGMTPATVCLKPVEEDFLRALLWEEAHLINGPATQSAQRHGLPLIRCLEPITRMVPNFHGEALNRIREGSCPVAEWPWAELDGDEVLRLLWARLAETRTGLTTEANAYASLSGP